MSEFRRKFDKGLDVADTAFESGGAAFAGKIPHERSAEGISHAQKLESYVTPSTPRAKRNTQFDHAL